MRFRNGTPVFMVGLMALSSVSAAASTPLRVNFLALRDFSSSDTTKVHQAANVLERVLNSEEFKNRVLNFTWQGQKEFANNNGMSNEQIYSTLMAGKEKFESADSDHVMDLDLTLYSGKKGVVGYTYPNVPRLWLNRYWYSRFQVAEVAGNLTHEWIHKLGFDHDFNFTARRPFSVPYAIGDLVAELGAKESLR